MQAKEFINQAVKNLTQVDSLNEELKYLKDDAKESGLDVASLVAVAQAVVKANVDKLKNKSELILNMIEEYRS